ncbi:MAG: hypothetical protein PHT02_01195 [Tissierellia bacterium]|nr:hypothetical protein [Tissierellia bacterium]
MKIDFNEIACININKGNTEVIEPQFQAFLNRANIKKYKPTDDEIKEEKWTVLRVFYNTITNKVIDSKLVLDYSIDAIKPEIDFLLTDKEKDIICKTMQSDYGKEFIEWEGGL